MKRVAIFIAGTALLGAATMAGAQQGTGQPDGAQQAMSTRAEVEARTAKDFAMLDANNDQKITQAELSAFKTKVQSGAENMQAQLMADADTDGSKSLNAEEWGAMHEKRFAAMSAKAGKTLTDAQMKQAQARMQQAFDRFDADKNGSIDKAELAQMVGGNDAGAGMDRMFASADANDDGTLTLTEMQAPTLSLFDQADSDGDGRISKEEREKAIKDMRAQGRAKRGG